MVTLIEGRIGSGKTYFAVREVLYSYYRFDMDKVHWVLRDDIDEVAIYSNVDGFWAANSLDDAIKVAGGLDTFFSESYQKKFTKLKRHVYVIDEAQKSSLFHRKFYNPDVFYVFEYSRHFGIDFILITQDIWKLSPGLMGLPEIHIKVQRRSLSIFKNSFTYMYMSEKDILRKKTLRKDPRVFAAYRSQRVLVKDVMKSFTRRYIAIIAMLFVVIGCSFFYFIHSFGPGSLNNVPVKKSVVIVDKPVERVVCAVVGDYVYYRQSGKVVKEKKSP
ncbi:MAG: zonular occludens toxin domain-containing protein [Bacteroidota bacterium]|mgnify:FL=1